MTASLPLPRSTPVRRTVYVAVVTLSASLTFLVQPMVTKMLLPQYGGSGAVWTTAVMFFQVALLGGYAYAHVATRRLPSRVQVGVHLLVVGASLLALPIVVEAGVASRETASTVLGLLAALTVAVAPVFVLTTATGPLVQRWFSWSEDPQAHDPHFLYAASNLGSIGGLLAYPFLVERAWDLDRQAAAWSVGYATLLVLLLGAGLFVQRGQTERIASSTDTVPRGRQARWLGLAILPSSLMLGVTASLTTDVAPVPLLWILPLAVYLLTFVIAFSDRGGATTRLAGRLCGPALVLSGLAVERRWSLPATVGLSLLAFGCVALLLHQRLADDRPAPEHLTHFYVLLAVGGAIGGAINAFGAPLLLPGPFEYAIVLVGAAVLVGWHRRGPSSTRAFVLGTGPVAVAAILLAAEADEAVLLPMAGLAALVLLGRAGLHPLALILPAVIAVGPPLVHYVDADNVHLERTFYGSYRVTQAADVTRLVSGTTLHGMQDLAVVPPAATAYYGPHGPLGDVMADRPPGAVGVIGLGAGTMAAWARPGESMTFFEIDPAVARIASEPRWFTYLSHAGDDVSVVIDDGRRGLGAVPDETYALLALDAFTSDSVPAHLLTVEAVREYLRVVDEEGLVVVHISNRHLDLERVLAGVAGELGLAGRLGIGDGSGTLELPSTWVVLAREAQVLAGLTGSRWRPLSTDRATVWTDRHSDIVSILR